MANATKDLKIDAGQGQDFSFPVAASTKIYAGTFGATDASGNAIATLTSTSKIWGRVEKQADNSAGAAGAINVEVREGKFYYTNDTTNPCAAANRGALCYAVDNNTVGTSDVGGTLPVAGVIVDVPASGDPKYGYVYVDVGKTRPDALNTELGALNPAAERMRGVVTSNIASLAAFTVAQSDVTYVKGDQVLLVNQTTGSQNGPWVVGTVAAGAAPLTRPDWWASGSVQPPVAIFEVSEGNGANSEWVVRTAGAVTVDTTAINIEMRHGNWVQGVSTAVGTQATPSGVFIVGATLKARLSGIFRVDINIAYSNNTTADPVTVAFVTDTSADGAGAVLASANKAAHGVSGLGAYGTRGSDWESVDSNGGAAITFNGAAWSTAPVTQASEQAGTLTGLLTANGTGTQKFNFSGVVYNAAPTGTTKTPFTIGNQCAFGVKVTAAAGTLSFGSVRMTITELPSQ